MSVDTTTECGRCAGCGQIANSADGEPWSVWLNLPLGSSVAVIYGLVKPIACPDCGGTGRQLVQSVKEEIAPPADGESCSRTIICLCGSTRFWRSFQRASLAETLDGNIVLSIGAATGTDDDHFARLTRRQFDQVKADLDDLHCDKIALAQAVLILNEDDYIGQSTRRELEHARTLRKVIYWWKPTDRARPGEYVRVYPPWIAALAFVERAT